jgi:hypothetical protein
MGKHTLCNTGRQLHANTNRFSASHGSLALTLLVQWYVVRQLSAAEQLLKPGVCHQLFGRVLPCSTGMRPRCHAAGHQRAVSSLYVW